jgi:predicted dithiol-disulfide oxidoreductase (DUF899 family)
MASQTHAVTLSLLALLALPVWAAPRKPAQPTRPARQAATETETQRVDKEIARLQAEIEKNREAIAKLRRSRPAETVQDYTFKGAGGKSVRLSELFGGKQDLIVVHNMGKGCNYCTLWADGFNGVAKHLQDRAALVVVSPDEPEVQKEFASSRGWTFPMCSIKGTSFSKDLGLRPLGNSLYPGVSALLKKADGTIVRVSKDFLGPGDVYCSVWHLFDLLEGGAKGWEPKPKY